MPLTRRQYAHTVGQLCSCCGRRLQSVDDDLELGGAQLCDKCSHMMHELIEQRAGERYAGC